MAQDSIRRDLSTSSPDLLVKKRYARRSLPTDVAPTARPCESTHVAQILIRPRITDYYGIGVSQADVDFAIPFLDEDIPLYVDPFLLWKSPSQQDQALHTVILNSFNHLNWLLGNGKAAEAERVLIVASDCPPAGLGHSRTRRGTRIGSNKAQEILSLFRDIDVYSKRGFRHFEEIQLYVRDIASDRVSDIACNFLMSFLVDFTRDACLELGIPMSATTLPALYDYRENSFQKDVSLTLPVNPNDGSPIVFVPKRWLRLGTWLNFDDYFKSHCPSDDTINPGGALDPVRVLRRNRDNYGLVEAYVALKERTAADCSNDPLFTQIPVTSAKKKLTAIKALPTGKTANADQKFEQHVGQLLSSLLYPQLDFAKEQSRIDSGTQIRDLIFYNTETVPFLRELHADYGSRQLVFELKNVAEIDRDHINQLNRYLDSGLGKFGVFVTRHPLSRAMFRNTVDLWSGQRRCIVALTDEDLDVMVEVFVTKQRSPLEVLARRYIEFRRACPS